MNSIRKWTRGSTEFVCLYSSSQVYGNSKEVDQELHRVLLLIFLIEYNRTIKERDQEVHRGLCLYPSSKVYGISEERDQELHRGFCLYCTSRVCEISKEINQELQRGLLLILLVKNVWNQGINNELKNCS